jgi:hypothetical protein
VLIGLAVTVPIWEGSNPSRVTFGDEDRPVRSYSHESRRLESLRKDAGVKTRRESKSRVTAPTFGKRDANEGQERPAKQPEAGAHQQDE